MTISLAIQIVTTMWHKSERGARDATIRVALPQAFVMQPAQGPVTIQSLCYHRWDAPPRLEEQRHTTSLDFKVLDLRFVRTDPELVRVSFIGEGKYRYPPRRPIPDIMLLAPGTFGRLVVNGGRTYEQRGWHESRTYNIAFGEDIALDRFVSASPDKIRDLSVDLR